MAAISFLLFSKICSNPSVSLYSKTKINSLLKSGTPPSLLTIAACQSCHTPPLPQYAILFFFVRYLAALTAPVTALEPDFSNLTISALGIILEISSEHSTSIGCGSENKIPCFNCSIIASFTGL